MFTLPEALPILSTFTFGRAGGCIWLNICAACDM